jgi:putative tRNA adenosine deaminase-associated protein
VLAVAYFAALLARSADRWTARDADLDEIEDVAGLVELMREVPEDDDEEDEPDTTVLLLEQEDVWFAVVRLDAEEDPRLFVSDVAAVSRSAYGELLLAGDLAPIGPDGRPAAEPAIAAPGAPAAAEIEPDVDIDAAVGDDIAIADTDGDDENDTIDLAARPDLAGLADADPDERRPLHSGPAGDADLLADFGVRATKLVGLCRGGLPPADALADLAEALGAADELEEVR